MLRRMLAICAFLEIISARTIREPSTRDIFRGIALKLLATDLNATCNQIQQGTCGEQQVADLSHDFEPKNKKELCRKYPFIFNEVSCILESIDLTKCNETRMENIWHHVSSLKISSDVTCNTKTILLKKFCSEFENYVQELLEHNCTSSTH